MGGIGGAMWKDDERSGVGVESCTGSTCNSGAVASPAPICSCRIWACCWRIICRRRFYGTGQHLLRSTAPCTAHHLRFLLLLQLLVQLSDARRPVVVGIAGQSGGGRPERTGSHLGDGLGVLGTMLRRLKLPGAGDKGVVQVEVQGHAGSSHL
jgi:hypothetical protein